MPLGQPSAGSLESTAATTDALAAATAALARVNMAAAAGNSAASAADGRSGAAVSSASSHWTDETWHGEGYGGRANEEGLDSFSAEPSCPGCGAGSGGGARPARPEASRRPGTDASARLREDHERAASRRGGAIRRQPGGR